MLRIRNAGLRDGRRDVTLSGGVITAIESPTRAAGAGPELDARGGALLPGLHDHHAHLLAWAARQTSVCCGPPAVEEPRALAAALGAARPDAHGWIRGTDYHESIAGELDRERLDDLRGDTPVRIQHRTGAAWFLNSRAVEALGLDDGAAPRGAERDARGRANGRLLRADAWLRERLPAAPPDLGSVGRELSRFGVTGVTDATASNGAKEWTLVERARSAGLLPQFVHWMGGDETPAARDGLPPHPFKLVLDDWDLPTPEELAERIAAAHSGGRPVAIHCVTRAELVAACAALEVAGVLRGDRIEHAFVAPPELVEWLRRLRLTVVIQPGFLHARGDAYLRDVEAADRPWLHRARSLQEAGIPVGAGSDAPFGPADPWLAMQTAVDRRTRSGRSLGPREGMSPEQALALYATPPEDPGGPPRLVEVGARADLCLLAEPWERARLRLRAGLVRATWCAGVLVWDRETARSECARGEPPAG